MILLFIKYLFLFFVVSAVFLITVDRVLKTPRWTGPKSDHFNGREFVSRGDAMERDSGDKWKALMWMITRDKKVWKDRNVIQTRPENRVEGSDLVVTFVNHATVLIQTRGLNILTDPIWSDRASPVSFLGPRRHVDPGVAFSDLPRIDVVLISHNHYDHLDVQTLRCLKKSFNSLFIVPLGNKEFLKKKGIEAHEVDWWDSKEIGADATVTFVPAQHFSARALSDRNTSLWGGYVVHTIDGDVYFAGDTGYGPFFDEIRDKYPDGFRFGILPIGAYRPEWFMSLVHMGPDEAVRAARELGIKKALAIHFGTFKLADDGQDEPVDALNTLQEGKNIIEALPNGGVLRI